jgi:hypothetical protein
MLHQYHSDIQASGSDSQKAAFAKICKVDVIVSYNNPKTDFIRLDTPNEDGSVRSTIKDAAMQHEKYASRVLTTLKGETDDLADGAATSTGDTGGTGADDGKQRGSAKSARSSEKDGEGGECGGAKAKAA